LSTGSLHAWSSHGRRGAPSHRCQRHRGRRGAESRVELPRRGRGTPPHLRH
jgi:hypothetical protein